MDLQFAIDVSKYQVRLATLGRWNTLPMGLLSITGLLEVDKPLWIAAVLVIFLLGANYAAGWESNIYEARLHELERLKNKLVESASRPLSS